MLEAATIFIAIVLLAHLFILMFHNAFRIKKLLKYIDQFKKAGKLENEGFEILHERYTSVFHYLEFYPDKDDYKVLYENPEFASYVRRSKWTIKYCAIAIGISFLFLLGVLALDHFAS